MTVVIGNSPPSTGGSALAGAIFPVVSPPATLIDCTGFAGDTDGDYEIWGEIFLASAPGSVQDLIIEPNALTANQVTERIEYQSTAVNGRAALARITVGQATAGFSGSIGFWARLIASKSGVSRNRYVFGKAVQTDGFAYDFGGVWTDTTTGLISFRVIFQQGGADQASRIATGSYVGVAALGRPA